ncbi:hypothetical protein CONPUDRAFT_80852 [Coniophora puteana RWD-64-598 SS2]|uniref:DUF3295 domain-containing protein n=1 Tax=Coniophora puteana (strain RWD-64-598) TaxID=741705 RepID=A0A5M3MZL3_CONPW|nr:uncharacterized protein CONPUDRAFT_80852 [Coniophora puteana RWD-64-598 SS2]EIW84603.1 hypothetical protein CONPUDRAFT_80852 [Coniophora puteana RWD-64-598 SS2]
MAFPKVVVVNPTPHPTPPMTPILRSDDNPNAPAPPQSTFLLPPSPAAALSASKIAPSAERSDAISSRPSHQPHQAQGSREPAQQQKSQPHAQLHPLSTLSPAQAPESLSRLDAGRSPGLFFLKHSPDDVSPDRESSTTSKSPSDRYEASSGGSGSSAIMMQRHAASMAAKDMAVVAPDVPLHDEPETMEEDADDNDDAVSVAASNAPSRGPSRAGGRIRKAGGGKAGIVRPAMARRAHSSRFIPPSLQRRSSTHSETAVVAKQEKEKEKEKEGRTTPRAASSSNLVANDFKAPQMKRAAQSSMQLAPKLSALTMTAPNASTTTSGPSAAKPIEPSPLAVLPPVVVAPEPPTLVETPPLSQPPPVAQPAAVDDATAQVQVQAQAPNGLQGRRVVVAQTSSEDYETTTDVEESDWASDEVEVDGDADIPVVAAAPAIVRSTSRGGRSNRLAEQFRMTRAAEREKAERARAEETRLREAALEAQRQREMFQKVPKRSYSNLNRSRSGLLSQLMNPDPTIFPPSHPYRQSRSAQDMSKMRSGLQPMTAHTSAQANGRAPQTPSGSGLQAGAVPAPSRMQTSKSAAAVPTQVNATVTVKSPLSNGIVAGVPEKPAPPRNAQAQPLDKLREKEREKAAAGGYRPKGRPTEVEMEMEESDDEDAQGQDDKIQMSESIAQQKLAALASKRAPGPKTGNTSTNHRQHATDGAGAKRATPSLAQQVAQAAMPMFAMQKATASAAQPTAGTTHTTATAVPVPQPIPMGHPYNFPVYALPMTPRTTRRQMLKTELSESLRRQLLWERQVSNQNLVGARRSSHNGALGGGVAPMTAVRSEGQVQARGQGQGQGQSQAQGQVQGQNQQRQGGGQGQTGQGEGAARSAEEESREARRRAAFARNRSWANDYHYAGW